MQGHACNDPTSPPLPKGLPLPKAGDGGIWDQLSLALRLTSISQCMQVISQSPHDLDSYGIA